MDELYYQENSEESNVSFEADPEAGAIVTKKLEYKHAQTDGFITIADLLGWILCAAVIWIVFTFVNVGGGFIEDSKNYVSNLFKELQTTAVEAIQVENKAIPVFDKLEQRISNIETKTQRVSVQAEPFENSVVEAKAATSIEGPSLRERINAKILEYTRKNRLTRRPPTSNANQRVEKNTRKNRKKDANKKLAKDSDKKPSKVGNKKRKKNPKQAPEEKRYSPLRF